MEQNRDWKVPAALILAGLALLVALNGRGASPFMGGGPAQQNPAIVITGSGNDQPRIVIGSGDAGGPVSVAPVPAAPVAPVAPNAYGGRFAFGHEGRFFPFFALIPLALLFLFVFRFARRGGWHRYGHPYGGYGPPRWQGYPGQQNQGPQPGQGQGPQPGQGPGHWEWHADAQAPRAEQAYGDDQGDITRPGQGRQE